MNLPRKGVLIRIAIYVPLIGYFGWQALDAMRTNAELEAQAEGAALEPEPEPDGPGGRKPHHYETLPDGSKIPVYEYSEAEAQELFGEWPDPDTDTGADTDTDTSAAGSDERER